MSLRKTCKRELSGHAASSKRCAEDEKVCFLMPDPTTVPLLMTPPKLVRMWGCGVTSNSCSFAHSDNSPVGLEVAAQCRPHPPGVKHGIRTGRVGWVDPARIYTSDCLRAPIYLSSAKSRPASHADCRSLVNHHTTSTMSVSLEHSSLRSTLEGVRSPGVTQFRGIPYGRIPRRFAAPEAIETYPAQLDCTKYGYAFPSTPLLARPRLTTVFLFLFFVPAPDALKLPSTLVTFCVSQRTTSFRLRRRTSLHAQIST